MTGLLRLIWRLLRHPRRELYYGAGPHLMSALRQRWILLTHPSATITFGPGVHVGPGFSLYMPHAGTLEVGARTEFRKDFRAEIVSGGSVKIGADCIFSYNGLIQCTSSVEIGDRCGFGQSMAIFDGNHRYRDPDRPFLEQGFDLRPVRIGDDVMALTKCTILNDVGDHAVIGANSVVVKPVPAYTVAGGVPARVLDYFGPEDSPPVELIEPAASEGSG